MQLNLKKKSKSVEAPVIRLGARVSVAAMIMAMVVGIFYGGVREARAAGYVKSCVNRDKGVWGYGSAPVGCDADRFGNIGRIHFIYGDYIFDRRNHERRHREEYVTNMYALIKKMATDYFRSRHPKGSESEVQAWVRAVLTVASQESYMSHYRIGPDERYKLMTGDSTDSHGMMQVNQKYHASRPGDSSFDLVGNILTAMEIYYREWMRVPNTGCYDSLRKQGASLEKRLEARARGAYSAYNGGPGSICRYSNPKHRWHKNDLGFLEKWQKREWRYYLLDETRAVSIDVNCLINGDDICGAAKPVGSRILESSKQFLLNKPLVLEDGRTCVTASGSEFDCVTSFRGLTCMVQYDPDVLNSQPIQMRSLGPEAIVRVLDDRDALCRGVMKGLVRIGEVIRFQKKLVVRESVDGKAIAALSSGREFQVLDYEVRPGPGNKRYYRIRIDARTEAYVYGGTDEDHSEWVQKSESVETQAQLYIPVRGSIIEINLKERKAAEEGAWLREAPAESAPVLTRIPQGTRLQVEELVVRDNDNGLYARVRHGKTQGFVYVGRSYPTLTVSDWIRILN